MKLVRAVVLAAGEGTRLRPFTADRPKCLVPLAGRSLLDYQIAALREAGLDDITIVAGYRADAVRAATEARSCRVLVNRDYATTNMVSTLFVASALMTPAADLLVAYGDLVYETKILRSTLTCEAPICLPIDLGWHALWKLRMADPLGDAETLKLDASGRIREIGKKPRGYEDIQGQYLGIIKIAAAALPELRAAYMAMDRAGTFDGRDFAHMYMTAFLQHLIDTGWHVQSIPIEHGWLEVDTRADLELYERLHAAGELAQLCRLPDHTKPPT